MLPEISARRSLLELSFRYLSPGREGEKCRLLDHTWQNPFVHSARSLQGSNSNIYNSILIISSMWYVQVCHAVVHIQRMRMRSCTNTLNYGSEPLQVLCFSIRYALVHTSAKYMTSTTHVHSLYKQNSPLSRLDFFFGGSSKPFSINTEKRRFYSSTVVTNSAYRFSYV